LFYNLAIFIQYPNVFLKEFSVQMKYC